MVNTFLMFCEKDIIIPFIARAKNPINKMKEKVSITTSKDKDIEDKTISDGISLKNLNNNHPNPINEKIVYDLNNKIAFGFANVNDTYTHPE